MTSRVRREQFNKAHHYALSVISALRPAYQLARILLLSHARRPLTSAREDR
jgi:hypothetical protein